MGGFKDFVFRGNLIQLGVAVVIGAAFGNLVTQFTAGLITPLLGIFGEQPSFRDLNFTINGSAFRYGSVIDALINFLLTALVIYYAVVFPSTWVMDKFKNEEESNKRDCPKCCSQVSKKATKCAFCTADFAPEPDTVKVENETDEDKENKKALIATAEA